LYFIMLSFFRYLDSFPTRRSSDLAVAGGAPAPLALKWGEGADGRPPPGLQTDPVAIVMYFACDPEHRQPAQSARHPHRPRRRWRSEEHTSELQSRENLVCRLLLEK